MFDHLPGSALKILAHQKSEGELFFKNVTEGMTYTAKVMVQIEPVLVDHGYVYVTSVDGKRMFGKFDLNGKKIEPEKPSSSNGF